VPYGSNAILLNSTRETLSINSIRDVHTLKTRLPTGTRKLKSGDVEIVHSLEFDVSSTLAENLAGDGENKITVRLGAATDLSTRHWRAMSRAR